MLKIAQARNRVRNLVSPQATKQPNCQTTEIYLIQLKFHFLQESTNMEKGKTEE